MNTDIRIYTDFKGHWKRKNLERLIGAKGVLCLIDLWISTSIQRPEGVLTGWDEVDIAEQAGWKGKPEKFINALMNERCTFLEKDAQGNYALRNWKDRQPWAIGALNRSAAAKKAADTRWGKLKETAINTDADLCDPHKSALPSASESQCPYPYLSSPNLSSPNLSSPNEDNISTEPQAIGGPIPGIEIKEEGEILKKPKKPRENRKLPPELLEEVKKVEAWLREKRGYPSPRFGAERSAIGAMVKMGFGADQITICWLDHKKEKFYSNKELFMMSIQSQIQNWDAGKNRKFSSQNSTNWHAELQDRAVRGELQDHEWLGVYRPWALEHGHLPPAHIIKQLEAEGKWPDPRFPELAEKAAALFEIAQKAAEIL